MAQKAKLRFKRGVMNIVILGAGGWGIALANLLSNNGNNVVIWSPIQDEIDMLYLNREHLNKLPGIKINDNIAFTSDIVTAINDKSIVVFATPSSFIRSTARLIKDIVEPHQIIINVAKGIEKETLMTLKEVICDELPDNPVAVLSGPSHAEEVARLIPTTVLVASDNDDIIKLTQDIFMNDYFRVYGNNDILGVEIGGAIKNVIALAAGIADGLGYGDNTKAALMTRGMAEIIRLGTAMGANASTFYGLSGIGDLIVTCTSMNSRNRRAGILIGKGYTMQEAMDEVNMVVEGVFAVQAGVQLADKYNVEMPITRAVYNVLYNNQCPKEAVIALMNRDKKYED